MQYVTDEISAYHCQSKQFFDTPNSTLILLFMCCTLVYDKFLLCKFKGSAYREVFFVLREKLGIRSLFDIVFSPLFSSFANESSMKTHRLRMCKS